MAPDRRDVPVQRPDRLRRSAPREYFEQRRSRHMSKKPVPDRVTLTFDLLDLPTAQHRAGLAGLILQVASMGPDGNDRGSEPIPVIGELPPTAATITFTRASMQGVFDDLYAAKLVDGKYPSPKKKDEVIPWD